MIFYLFKFFSSPLMDLKEFSLM